ncbi:PTS transporter subunit EIIB [bacterium]|nr:PTS transporter subunit EIIB [bacterium]
MTPGREEDKGASAEAEEASARAALKSSDAGEPSVLDTVYAPQAGRPTISDASDSSEAGGTSVRGAVYAARSGRDAAGAAADSSGAGETSVRSSVYAPRSGRPTVSDLAESPHSGRSFVQDSAGSSPLGASSVRNTNGPQAGKAYLWDTANGPHAGRGANRDAANRPQTGRSSVRETGVPQGGPPSVWNSVELHPAKAEVVVEDQFMDMASGILEGIGGIDNLISLDNCITRLRMEVKNSALVNEARIKDAGARAVLRTGRNSVQVVIGTEVQFVADAFREIFRVDK